MGWKNVRDHYRIDHIVQVVDGKILIGSMYIHDLMTVKLDGTIAFNSCMSSTNANFNRYQTEMEADREKLVELINAPDSFEASIPVWTYEDGKILELTCEELGWPNVTHDGRLMFDNTFFKNRSAAVKAAISNGEAGVRLMEEIVERSKNDLARNEANLEDAKKKRDAYLAEGTGKA